MNVEQKKCVEQLYLEMYDMLFYYARTVLQDEHCSEEAVQETFRIACGKPDALLESPNPRGWLVNTLKGVLRNFLRAAARESKVFVQLSDPELLGAEDADDLPPELLYQDLARTRDYELLQKISQGCSIRDLSQRLGVSESACKKRVQRSKKILQEKLSKIIP